MIKAKFWQSTILFSARNQQKSSVHSGHTQPCITLNHVNFHCGALADWKTDGTPAAASSNLVAVFFKADGSVEKVVPHYSGATIVLGCIGRNDDQLISSAVLNARMIQ
jgi:hypothetical protein